MKGGDLTCSSDELLKNRLDRDQDRDKNEHKEKEEGKGQEATYDELVSAIQEMGSSYASMYTALDTGRRMLGLNPLEFELVSMPLPIPINLPGLTQVPRPLLSTSLEAPCHDPLGTSPGA